jgi:hypothetical protein
MSGWQGRHGLAGFCPVQFGTALYGKSVRGKAGGVVWCATQQVTLRSGEFGKAGMARSGTVRNGKVLIGKARQARLGLVGKCRVWRARQGRLGKVRLCAILSGWV